MEVLTIKTLTIYQPYASLISLGEKGIESRSWKTNYKGLLAIHAGLKIDHEACQKPAIRALLAKHGLTEDNLPTGAVLAIAQLDGCYRVLIQNEHVLYADDPENPHEYLNLNPKETDFGNLAPGRYAWVLGRVKALPHPVPAKGKMGLWTWEPPV